MTTTTQTTTQAPAEPSYSLTERNGRWTVQCEDAEGRDVGEPIHFASMLRAEEWVQKWIDTQV